MPELPDIELYIHALKPRLIGSTLTKIIVRSPALLRTYDPAIETVEGRAVAAIHRLGKRIVWEFEPHATQTEPLFLVFHLMIAGRFHLRKGLVGAKGKSQLAAFQFQNFTLLLTEVSQQKRASLHVVAGPNGLKEHERDGIDVRDSTFEAFNERLDQRNRTIKRALTDPSLFDGIGNAYSDEILHAAKISPLKWTSHLTEDERRRLHTTAAEVLRMWQERLIVQHGDKFPEKVTAFRPEMSVHGRFKEPCPCVRAAGSANPIRD